MSGTINKCKASLGWIIKDAFSRFGNPNKQCNVGGYTIDVDIREGIQKGIYSGHNDVHETAWVTHILKHGMTVVDIGASFGYYSFLASSLVGKTGMVYAFEPSNHAYEKFTHNIEKNGITNIKPYCIALGETEDDIEMFDSVGIGVNVHNIHAPSFMTKHYENAEERSMGFIRTIRFDKFWEEHGNNKIDFMKIDVEGFELPVLRGMESLFEKRMIKYIMIEYMQRTPLFSEGTDSAIMHQMLNLHGFKIINRNLYEADDVGFMGNFLYELKEIPKC